MKVIPREVTVRELVGGYHDDGEEGVVGYGGRLDIRPPYQREFVYKAEQRDAVIETIKKSFPLNVMYWADCDDGQYEVIDGQQRTISIAQYVEGDFSLDDRYFHNLRKNEQDQILDYPLTIYVCIGADSDKLDWFRTINIAGERLTNQELRNAVYSGSWVSDAKRYFSRTGCPAQAIGGDYMSGAPIRQEFLETAIRWVSGNKIDDYMAQRQQNPTAKPLWDYFRSVIDWVEQSFTVSRPKMMRGVDWGRLHRDHKDDPLDADDIEARIQELIDDEDVKNHKGVYEYILTGDERHLNLRSFSTQTKRRVYQTQGGKCAECGEEFPFNKVEADHITPWGEGGKTVDENCQVLCREHNRRKGAR